LEVACVLAREEQTPNAFREESMLCGVIGDLVHAQGKVGEAERFFRQGLECALAYQRAQPSPDADDFVHDFEDQLRHLSKP
jgi:hypothetical protein